jgi:hypothetical protein
MPAISSMAFGNLPLQVFTRPIIVNIKGVWYDLGDWMIEIDTRLGSTTTRIVCVRITRKDGVSRHPYSTAEDGQICFGLSCNQQLYELQRRGEYLPLISIIVERLAMWNVGQEPLITIAYPRLPDVVAHKILEERRAAELAAKEAL